MYNGLVAVASRCSAGSSADVSVQREIVGDADAHRPSSDDADHARRRVRVFLIHVVLSAGFGGGSLGAGSATSSAQE
jgi:hypothetical protein